MIKNHGSNPRFLCLKGIHLGQVDRSAHLTGITPNGLLPSTSGTLYGMAFYGGTYNAGLVYELSQSGGVWRETVLYNFTGGSDGGNPSGPLVMDEAGNLYGTTLGYGIRNAGVVFELSPSGGTWTEMRIPGHGNAEHF
jgi:uncharacterized repeat protein (TIGR03803 family)